MRTLALALLALLSGCAEELALQIPDDPSRGGPPVAGPADVAGFYGVLADRGSWVDTDWGDAWCPSPSAVGGEFTPYTRGHFEPGEAGWTWVGDLPMSWAVEHYGRWAQLDDAACPWGWLPDGDWGPAWVDFSIGGGVIAWEPMAPAPLPEGDAFVAGGGVSIPAPPPGRVRVAPPSARGAMTHLAARRATDPALPSAQPTAEARRIGAGDTSTSTTSSSSSTSSPTKVVAMVRESDFLAGDLFPLLLRGPARQAAMASLQPATPATATGAALRAPSSRLGGGVALRASLVAGTSSSGGIRSGGGLGVSSRSAVRFGSGSSGSASGAWVSSRSSFGHAGGFSVGRGSSSRGSSPSAGSHSSSGRSASSPSSHSSAHR